MADEVEFRLSEIKDIVKKAEKDPKQYSESLLAISKLVLGTYRDLRSEIGELKKQVKIKNQLVNESYTEIEDMKLKICHVSAKLQGFVRQPSEHWFHNPLVLEQKCAELVKMLRPKIEPWPIDRSCDD